MKYVLSILLSLICVFSTIAAEKKQGRAVIQTVINCNHCKACETCGLKFKNRMLKIKGVKMYELDEQAQTITVYFAPKKTNLETIKYEISKLGYDADDVKADPIAYANLDGCCKPK